ncbi:hypothetical protein GCM10027575_29500 [Phytohabitans suffuscus]
MKGRHDDWALVVADGDFLRRVGHGVRHRGGPGAEVYHRVTVRPGNCPADSRWHASSNLPIPVLDLDLEMTAAVHRRSSRFAKPANGVNGWVEGKQTLVGTQSTRG